MIVDHVGYGSNPTAGTKIIGVKCYGSTSVSKTESQSSTLCAPANNRITSRRHRRQQLIGPWARDLSNEGRTLGNLGTLIDRLEEPFRGCSSLAQSSGEQTQVSCRGLQSRENQALPRWFDSILPLHLLFSDRLMAGLLALNQDNVGSTPTRRSNSCTGSVYLGWARSGLLTRPQGVRFPTGSLQFCRSHPGSSWDLI